jgi:outer membrane protein
MKVRILLLVGFSVLSASGCATEQTATEPSLPVNHSHIRAGTIPRSVGEKLDVAKEVHQAETRTVGPQLTLEQCIKTALKNNPQVIGAGWDISAAKADKDIAAGQQWPIVGIEGTYRHFLDDQRLVMPRYANEPGVYGEDILAGDIVLRMPIFTGGRIENEIKAADLLRQSAEHHFARTREEVVFNVSHVFYNILAQIHIIESLAFSRKTLEEHHKRVSDLVNVQKAARVDLLRTDVRLADVNQRLVAEKNVLSILRRVLANLLGLSSAESEVDVEGDLQLKAVDANLPQSLAEAYAKRSDYLATREEVDAQARRLETARAGHLPIVSVEGAYGLRNSVGPTSHPAGTDDTEEVGFIGVGAIIPIFEGGQIPARVTREHAKLISLRERLRKLKLQIKLDVETAILNINSSGARIDATAKSIEQAKESLRIEREKYEIAKGSITNVLDAQAALLDAQTTYYHALADYNSAVAQWRLSIGEEE